MPSSWNAARKSSSSVCESERACLRSSSWYPRYYVCPAFLRDRYLGRTFSLPRGYCPYASARLNDGNSFCRDIHVWLPASRALHVPIKNLSNFVVSRIGARLFFNFSLVKSYPMTRRNFFLDTGARWIRLQVSRKNSLPPFSPRDASSLLRDMSQTSIFGA